MSRINPSEEQIAKARSEIKSNPIYWFSRLMIALDQGDGLAEAESRRALHRLGWTVIRSSIPRASPREG